MKRAAWNKGYQGQDGRRTEEVNLDIWKSFCLCLPQTGDEACTHVCGCVSSCFFARARSTREQVIIPKPSGVSTSQLLSKYLEEIKRRGRQNHRERKRRKLGAREGQRRP